jgi:adenylate kinase
LAGRILILGGPGAGKGTQAGRVSEKYALAHISTGAIFRSHIERGTDTGKTIEEHMNSGHLVPDSLACEIVVDRLSEPDCANGYILDGFPRTIPQAEAFEHMLADRNESVDAALVLNVPDTEIVDRLTARRTCPECGKIYNLKFEQPTREGYCNSEGCTDIELVQREDDTEETIKKRLDVYHESTEPLIAFYEERALRSDVGGSNKSPDEVAAQIEDILKAKGAI